MLKGPRCDAGHVLLEGDRVSDDDGAGVLGGEIEILLNQSASVLDRVVWPGDVHISSRHFDDDPDGPREQRSEDEADEDVHDEAHWALLDRAGGLVG